MSSAIAQVQTQLTKLGRYKGKITGTLDAETRSALSQYQREVGLPDSGDISEETLMNLDTDVAKKDGGRVQVPQLKLVKQEPIPDFYNREFKELPAPRGGQDNARVPPEAGRIPSGPQVPRYTAAGMVPQSLRPRTPTTWLNGASDAPKEGVSATTALLILGSALAFGWWVGSRKGRGSPIIENDNPLGSADSDDAGDDDSGDEND